MPLVSNGAFVSAKPDMPYDELGSVTPMMAFGAYYGGGQVSLSGVQASYGALYKAQLWVAVVVNKRARALGRLPFKAHLKAADGSRLEAPDSLFGQLMAQPNDRHDPVFLWIWTQSTCDIYGEAIWIKIRDNNRRVRAVWPMHPTNTTTYRGDDGRWKYAFTTGARTAPILPVFDEADVVHFRTFNPDNTERGMSPLEPLNSTLLIEDAARRASAAMWRNGARPSMALTTDKKLSDTAYNRLVATWDDKHTGVDNWAKTAILEEGLKPSPIQLSAEEMQYIASRKLNREEVCAAYDMPPPAVQILDHATYSNVTEQNRALYRDTMAGVCGPLESTVRAQLAPDFFDSDGDISGRFDMDEVLRGSFEQQTAAYAQAIGTGQMTPQEARRAQGRPDIEGADQLVINAALIPLKVLESVAVADGGAIDSVPQKVKSLSAAQARTVQGRLSRATDVAAIDPVRVSADLGEASDVVLALLHAARARRATVADLRSWINATAESADLTPKELTA